MKSRGFQSPNHTQIPNDVLDYWLARLEGSELKVLLWVLRRTLGFHRRKAKISLTELERHTGMTRETVHKAAESLADTDHQLVILHKAPRRTTEIEVIWRKDTPDMGGEGSRMSRPGDSQVSRPRDRMSRPQGESDEPTLRKKGKDSPMKEALRSVERNNDFPGGRLFELLDNEAKGSKSGYRMFRKQFAGVVLEESGAGMVRLVCPTQEQADWIEDRWRKTIEHKLAGIGGEWVSVEVRVAEEPIHD